MLTWREVGLDDREQIEIDLGPDRWAAVDCPWWSVLSGPEPSGSRPGESAAVISPQAPLRARRSRRRNGDWPITDDQSLESSEIDPIAAGAIWPPVDRPPSPVPVLSPSSAPPPVPPLGRPAAAAVSAAI